MRNRYPGPCYRCTKRVEPGDGHFERKKMHGGRRYWAVIHAKCVFEQRNEKLLKGGEKK